MERLTIAPSKDRLLCGGKNWFWLADTAWSVFTNAGGPDWTEYLRFRAAQGFTVVQIDVLPQWDRSASLVEHPEPFLAGAGGWDLGRPNPAYFDRAEAMVREAAETGIRSALVLLWANYVPGNWCSKKVGGPMFREEQVETFVRFVVRRFAKYEPVLIVSGDTDFVTADTERCYLAALAAAKKEAPHLLTTLHISGLHDSVPDSLASSPQLDFYMYQSCHFLKSAPMPYELARKFLAKPVRRPVLNGEPCYEGLKAFDGTHRFTAFDVRRAAWLSFLSGATVGITYGAHGIWSWQASDETTHPEYVSLNSRPFPWRTALAFRGADDFALMKRVVESWGLHDAVPSPLVKLEDPEVRAAARPDGSAFAVYAPCALDLPMTVPLAGYDLTVLDLEGRRRIVPRLDPSGAAVITPHVAGDFVLLGRRR